MTGIVVTASDTDHDDLRELYDSLLAEPELRGRLTLSSGPAVPGTMGVLTEVLTAAVAPGGAGTAFAAVVITYLRQRGSSIELRFTRPDGASVDLSAGNVRELDSQAVRIQVADLARFLGEGAGDAHAGSGGELQQ